MTSHTARGGAWLLSHTAFTPSKSAVDFTSRPICKPNVFMKPQQHDASNTNFLVYKPQLCMQQRHTQHQHSINTASTQCQLMITLEYLMSPSRARATKSLEACKHAHHINTACNRIATKSYATQHTGTVSANTDFERSHFGRCATGRPTPFAAGRGYTVTRSSDRYKRTGSDTPANTAGYLSFGHMAQCVVHALKGLACRASPSRAR